MNGSFEPRRPLNATGRCRAGFTLVEALLSMTIGALIFGAAVVLLGVASHADSSDRAADGLQSLDRLAEQFRTDIRQATDVQPRAAARRRAFQSNCPTTIGSNMCFRITRCFEPRINLKQSSLAMLSRSATIARFSWN